MSKNVKIKGYHKELRNILKIGIARCKGKLYWGVDPNPRGLIETFYEYLSIRLKRIKADIAWFDSETFFQIQVFLRECVWDFEAKMGYVKKSEAEMKQSLLNIERSLRAKLKDFKIS